MEFWEWLAEEMKAQGLSGYALGKKAGLSSQTIYEIIRTKSSPRVDTAEKIQNALSVRYPGMEGKEKNAQAVGSLVKKARIARGLSPAALVKKAGVSRRTLSDWEAGKAEPGEEELSKVLKVLKVSYEDLFKDYDEDYIRAKLEKAETNADDISASCYSAFAGTTVVFPSIHSTSLLSRQYI